VIPFTKLYTGNKSYCSYMCWILPGSGVTDSNRVLQRPHVAPFAPSDDFSCFNDMAVRMLNACHPKALLQPVIIIILIICVHQAHASLAAPSAHPLTDIMTRAKKTATPDALRAPNPPDKYKIITSFNTGENQVTSTHDLLTQSYTNNFAQSYTYLHIYKPSGVSVLITIRPRFDRSAGRTWRN